MANLFGFDASTIAPAKARQPLPAGTYVAAIIDSEIQETKKGDGKYLKLTFEITVGDYQGRHLWETVNLWNPSPAAVEIAQARLSAICHAVGVLRPSDSTDLHHLPLVLEVGCRKRKDTGEIENVIKGFAAKAPPHVKIKKPKPRATPSQDGAPVDAAPWERS